MTVRARWANAGMDTSTGMFASQLSGDLIAGEDLPVVCPCYVSASDGKVYMCVGAANTAPSKFWGFTPRATKLGQSVTLISNGARFDFSNGLLALGELLYVGVAAGTLDNAATTGGITPIARAINTRSIQCIVTATF